MRSFRRFSRTPALAADGRTGFWPPSAANALVSIGFGCFVAQCILGRANLLEAWGALSGETLRNWQLWRLGTHLFLTDYPVTLLGNPLTLLLNALIIYLAGRNLEAIVGRAHFLGIYLLGGGLAGIVRALAPLYLPFETPRAGSLAGGDFLCGAGGAAMAVLVAFTAIMPELELGALVYLPAPAGRLKAKDFAAAGLILPAAVFAIFATPSLGAAYDPLYAHRLSCVGALVGALVGWLYARQLGFGRRWPSAQSRKERVTASVTAAAPTPADLSPAAPANSSWSPPPQPQPQPTAGTTATAAPPPSVSLVNSPASAAPAEAALTERERRMSAREYIAEAVDPVLEKISREGLPSLSDAERRVLRTAREKMLPARESR